MSTPSIPSIFYEFAFNADPNQSAVPPYWIDLSWRVQFGWTLTRGRQYELDTDEAGTWSVQLANPDGALDPGNAASPFAPILPYRPCRIRVVLGNNLLAPDAATAGEYAQLAAGPGPAWTGVTAFGSSPATIASVGAAAYQGSRVWTTTVPSGMAGADLLDVTVQAVTASTVYTFSTQIQAVTSGQNPSVYVAIGWIGANGSTLSTTSGSPTVLTGAAGVWTQISVTGQAPAGAVAAVLRVVTTTTPSAVSTVWADALQLEARGYASRFQMPWTPGVNLLPQTIATGSETMSATTDTVSHWWYPTAGTIAQATNLSAAPSGGTTAVAWTVPSGSTTADALYLGINAGAPTGPAADCVQVTPSQQFTASAYLTRSGPDTTVTMPLTLAWFNSSGGSLGTTVGSAATVPTSGWVRATVTGTAPAGATWARASLGFTTATLTGTEVVYGTGFQVEQASSATTWADPGAPCYLFTGLVERFPRTWDQLSGTYGTSKLECVDATAALAQMPLLPPFIQEVLALNPNFLYELNDPTGSTSCVDVAGKRVAAPVENSPYGAGSLSFGSSITSTNPTLAFVGAAGPVATFANSAPEPPYQNPATFVSIHKTTSRPGPPTNSSWTRIIHARSSAIPASGVGSMMWFSSPPQPVSAFFIGLSSNATGTVELAVADPAGNAKVYTTAANMCDGNWHQYVIAQDGSFNVTMYVDGVAVTPTGPALSGPIGPCVTDALGVYNIGGQGRYSDGFVGDLSCAVELPFVATSTQVSNLYNSWRTASSGESSGARYARILNWIAYPGATNIAAGSTASMGPATDTTGQTPLDALNGAATTENGESYVDSAGRLTFTARSALYGVRTPQVVFGEAQPVGNAGEWPCEIGSIDYDPSHLANIVQVTQYNAAIHTATDATSIRRYYTRLFQRTVNTSSGSEAQDAATYLLSQFKDPHQRADAIRLHPSGIVGLFPVVARIDKGVRIRYVKRPVGAPPTTLDGFIQRIVWSCSADLNDFNVEYQASPADLTNYWKIGALHTTLSAQAASGQNQATINALADAATNKLAQSMPTSQVLWFEPGTARFEAVTVQTIPTTSLGYGTATLTMTGNFNFTHPVGSVVCEALPSGYTDPTTWDASSLLAAAYAPILSGGASGTNTVTVGPMVDGAYNPAGSNWNAGDVVWLSSGVPARQEAATIQSVTTTYPGYSTCTITFTANLAQNHNAGEYVSDPLPSNTINPATWAAPTARAAY